MLEQGKLLTVSGISKKGKNRINEHGAVWEVIISTAKSVLLKSTDGKNNKRWFDFDHDEDWVLIDLPTIPED